jgi:RNA-directed DNA polymerase
VVAPQHTGAAQGPATQHRGGPDLSAHLLGRAAWVESVNPARGATLRARFEQIGW